jgi:hypothetical protein
LTFLGTPADALCLKLEERKEPREEDGRGEYYLSGEGKPMVSASAELKGGE